MGGPFPHGWNPGDIDEEAWHDTGGDGYSFPEDPMQPSRAELAQDAEDERRAERQR